MLPDAAPPGATPDTAPGEPIPRCGNQVINDGEACDDGNTAAGDGCTPVCQVEPGWACAAGGVCQAARCGDGLKIGNEECDDGNTSRRRRLQRRLLRREPPVPPSPTAGAAPRPARPACAPSVATACRRAASPATTATTTWATAARPFCRREPVCPAAGGACNTTCGDGLLLPADMTAGQACDDGNTKSGDGCSADCKLEMGYKCATTPVAQDPLRLPIVYRDFKAYNQAGGHPDFEPFIGMGESGIVEPMLGPMGKPVHVMGQKAQTIKRGRHGLLRVLVPGRPQYNMTIPESLTFTRLMNGGYQFASYAFYPLDGRGFGNYMVSPAVGGQFRNFHFTSEFRHWFEYRGNETLEFRGDDDLWVFINKRLAVDLGGVHSSLRGSVTLDAMNGNAQVCDLLNPCPAPPGARCSWACRWATSTRSPCSTPSAAPTSPTTS